MNIRMNMTEYKISENEALIIPEGTIGQCNYISDDCRLMIIAFSKNYLNNDINPQIAIVNQRYLSKSPILSLNNDEIEEFKNIYSNIKKIIENNNDVYKNEIIIKYIHILLYSYYRLIIKSSDFENSEKKNRKSRVFDQFMQELEEFHIKERKIGFYADKLCLTPKYLSQVIFEVSGRHAGDWIKDYVILEAKALLKSGQYSVQQVSDMLNFANQSFFGVYFKKAVGCSPLAYQNKP
ncbi:MAG: helix-turn-helix domain-containing protein [Bacteroidales bacterium]|nr:helix-turn-helix domain-containing protein [Bacteroidales bacterium]MBR5532403.1 helix-turn-helix domain-containing protein [Bacteroidales bacterium]